MDKELTYLELPHSQCTPVENVSESALLHYVADKGEVRYPGYKTDDTLRQLIHDWYKPYDEEGSLEEFLETQRETSITLIETTVAFAFMEQRQITDQEENEIYKDWLIANIACAFLDKEPYSLPTPNHRLSRKALVARKSRRINKALDAW